MHGSFSDESILEFIKLAYGEDVTNFSEEDIFSFTRCMRPNGSTYGTAGKCKKGTETGAKEVKPTSGRTRPKAAIESDMRKLTSSGAMQEKGLAGIKARAKHAALKAELNESRRDVDHTTTAAGKKSALDAVRNEAAKRAAAGDDKGVDAAIKAYNNIKKAQTKEESTPKRSQVDLVTPQKQGQADVDRMKKYLKDESDKLKNLNDAQKQNPSRPSDPDVVSRRKVLERNVAAVEKQLKDLERSKDTTNNPDRQAAIARISKEKGISAEKAGVEVDKIRMNELNEGVKKYQSMADKAREDGFASRAVSYGKQASELIRERADLQAKAKKSEAPLRGQNLANKMMDHLNITNRVAANHGGAIRTKAAKEEHAAELKKAGVPDRATLTAALKAQRGEGKKSQ
jgi:hypothetical protein